MNLISYDDPVLNKKLDKLSEQVLQIDNSLDYHIPSTLWVSDLHGEGDRFKSILKGRFGIIFQTCKEALSDKFTDQKIRQLVQIIRRETYTLEDQKAFNPEQLLTLLIEIIKYKINNVEYNIDEVIFPEFRPYILKLIAGSPIPESLLKEKAITYRFISHLCHTVKEVLVDRILVLGDIWDRGSQPDKIIRILSSWHYERLVDLIFGNHDILWMGAACGNRSLIAEALRISCRYDHFKLLKRLGINVSKLKKFAIKTYPVETCQGSFKAKTNAGKAMEKALSIIQFKLEDKIIADHPEFDMESRRSILELAKILKSGNIDQLNDTFFPTINLEDPALLTDEEAEIIDDLEKQFGKNKKLQRLLSFFFKKGKTYHMHDNLLNIHALIPSTADGEFEEFLGKKGKALLDFIQETINSAGKAYLGDKPQNEDDLALFFYLWCGPKSPLFGKQSMKTFERYYLKDKLSQDEPSLFWSSNMKTEKFKKKIFKEFNAQRVIFGHTPVDITKGKKMASEDGVAINIDGGFAEAYFNRGHALVQTAYMLYGIILPTPQELETALTKSPSNPQAIELIETFESPRTVRDTSAGRNLLSKQKKLIAEIRELSRP